MCGVGCASSEQGLPELGPSLQTQFNASTATGLAPACVQLDAPVVSKAFLNHDLATLKLHCGPELLERFSGIFKHFTEQVRAGISRHLLGHLQALAQASPGTP